MLGAQTDVGDLVVQEFMMTRDDSMVTVQVPTGTDALVREGLDTIRWKSRRAKRRACLGICHGGFRHGCGLRWWRVFRRLRGGCWILGVGG